MLRNTISVDSGSSEQLFAVRREVQFKLGGLGDPLLILIRLETQAINQLRHTRSYVPSDSDFIDHFINSHI